MLLAGASLIPNGKAFQCASLVDQGLIKLKPTARYVLQIAEYGFTANLPLEVVLADNFLLATHFDGDADHARNTVTHCAGLLARSQSARI